MQLGTYSQIALRVDAIEFTCLNETVEDRCAISTIVGSEEHVILPSDSNTAHGSFSTVVVYRQTAVLCLAA